MNHELDGWQSRRYPDFQRLEGSRVALMPTVAELDGAALYDATQHGDPNLWTYLPYGPFRERASFDTWLTDHVDDPSLSPVTIADITSGQALGNASYMSVVQDHGVLEIGHIILGATLQRTAAATEVLFLMLKHALDDLGYRRVEWKCDAANARSVRAASRLGFEPEGIFRQHRIVKGRNRDTAWFSIIDSDWPRVRAGFEAWLAPANFDEEGKQRQKLEELRQMAT